MKESPKSELRVLHCTEALGGGIISSLAPLIRNQARVGIDVTLAYTRRPDTPDKKDLEDVIFPDATLIEIPSPTKIKSWGGLASTLWGLTRSGTFDAVHLHSAIAGGIGRVVAFTARTHKRTFYSPHGFPFLRQDISPRARGAYRIIEKVGARIVGGLVLVSHSEAELAQSVLRARRTHVLRNGIDFSSLPTRTQAATDHLTPRVVMVGRVCYQKAPWVFAEAARKFKDRAEFVWVGDGDNDSIDEWIGNAEVQVTGWVTRERVLKEIANANVVLFPSLWEGMPLALMECQALGTPAVARDIVGNRDIVIDGLTGFLRESDEALLLALGDLIDCAELRQKFSAAATSMAVEKLNDRHLGPDSLEIYTNRVLDL